MDERGSLVGMSVDYLELITAKTGLQFELQRTQGFAPGLAAVISGESDVVMAVGKTKERAELFLFTVPFAFSPDAIVTRSDAPFMFDLSLLAGRRVGIASSSVSTAQSLATTAPGVEVVKYATMAEAVRAVASGEVFAAVTDASIAAFTAKQGHLTNVRVGGIFSGTGDMHLAVRRDWPELVAIFDRVLQAMPAAERAQITNRWVVLDYESDQRWRQAFSISAGVLALVALVLLLAILRARQRHAELAARRKIQAELEQAHAELERINRDKSELMRMMAHDLRNPLSTLTLSIHSFEQLRSMPLETQGEIIGEMRAALARMVDLINTLVDLHAIEEGKRSYRTATFALADVARDAVSALTESAHAKRLRLEVRAAEGLQPVESDPSAMRQVVDNLLSNAIKYSPPGTEVRIEVEGDAQAQRVMVRDQGPGLTAGDRARIFQKYGTGSARPTGGEVSTGLGLWIVDQIAKGLNGRVRCDSEPGKGAVFTFEVPLNRGLRSDPSR